MHCHQCGRPPPSEAHHRTGAGMGLKAKDDLTMPLCPTCHVEFHALSGPFKGMTREQARAWQDEAIDRYWTELEDVF